jgi:pyruvate,water dikinase
MAEKKKTVDKLLESLHERSKELNCLFEVEEILSEYDAPLEDVCPRIISAIPPGMQYSDVCVAKIVIENKKWTSDSFAETVWRYSADIVIQDLVIGTVEVYYTESRPQADHGPFLDEEAKLIRMIAERMGHFIMHKKMRKIVQQLDSSHPIVSRRRDGCEWKTIMDLLQRTDHELYMSISRKMLNHLCWSGIRDAEELMQSFGSEQTADNNFPDEQIQALIQKWIQEDKLSFLVQVVNRNLSLAEVADAIRRYHHLMQEEKQLPSPGKKGVLVSLIRRFLSDQLSYVNIAKNYIKVEDFYHLLQKVIFSTESHGKLGGKSAGLYLAAQILKKATADHKILSNVKVPKTWHITSDVLLHFMHYNNFDEVVEQKYKEINQVRLEYPHIVQTFKSAFFPTDIIKGLSVALDDFEDRPLIVRSSSLLEDRMGAAFSGKYKSLFLANQGSKQKRLDALMDAIAEVYASTFSPDPIEYRAERGLIDFGEEMGIMIQEVVGTRIGKYFLPAWRSATMNFDGHRAYDALTGSCGWFPDWELAPLIG